jgi:hypothetical protein
MATPPYLVFEGGEWRLDVSVGQDGRRRFALSDRAEALLVDELGYESHDIVPWMTAKTLALAGGLFLRDEKTDTRELAWSMTGADGGTQASTEELARVATYLRSVEIDQHAADTVREHVRETRLSDLVSPDDVRSKRERMNGLRGIAKDL